MAARKVSFSEVVSEAPPVFLDNEEPMSSQTGSPSRPSLSKMSRADSLNSDPDPSYLPKSLKVMGPRRGSLLARSMSIQSEEEKECHILVLYTGGTIGMRTDTAYGAYSPEANFLVPELRKLPIFHDPLYAVSFSSDVKEQPLVMPRQKDGKRIIYCVYEYEPLLDSSNMTYDDYALLSKDIEENYTDFDAFVVLHGTDTMAFTASALSFMLENLGKPVILTGSQIPIFEARSDGRDNFLGALIIAGNYNIPEVTIYFDNVLLRGNRSIKANSEAFDAFKSPNMDPLAKMAININVDWEAVFMQHGFKKFCVHTNMCRNVGVLRLFPSITESTVQAFLQPPMEGVVLQTYGAGNGPAARKDLMAILKEACDRGIIIVNCTQCSHGSVSPLYAVGKEMQNLGVIAGSDMTVEAALMKLSYVLSHEDLSVEEQRKMMSQNLRGEMTVASVTEGEHLHFPLINRLAEAMRIGSSQELHVLKNAVFPYLLCAAAREDNQESLKVLKGCGAHFHMSDYDGRTALHIAACEGHTEGVRYLLENGARVHVRDRYGHSPLDDAVRFNHYSVIKLLRQVGAHLTVPLSKQGMMMCNAVVNKDTHNLEAWFVAGAEFNQGDYDKRTPLHLAVASGKEDVTHYLLSRGALTDVPDIFGHTPLDEARRLNQHALIPLLEASLKSTSHSETIRVPCDSEALKAAVSTNETKATVTDGEE